MARRERRRGTGSRITLGDRGEDKLRKVPWSATTYPFPDARFADDREKVVAECRLYWLSDGTLAVDKDREYAIEDRPLMGTLEEVTAPK